MIECSIEQFNAGYIRQKLKIFLEELSCWETPLKVYQQIFVFSKRVKVSYSKINKIPSNNDCGVASADYC